MWSSGSGGCSPHTHHRCCGVTAARLPARWADRTVVFLKRNRYRMNKIGPLSCGGITEFSDPLLLRWVKTTGRIRDRWPTFAWKRQVDDCWLQKTPELCVNQVMTPPQTPRSLPFPASLISHAAHPSSSSRSGGFFCPLNRVFRGRFHV